MIKGEWTVAINESIIQLWASQALAMRPWPDERFPPSPYYRFLRVLAMNIQPSLSVELGVCGGGGSYHLAMGWGDGTVVGVDYADDHAENIAHIKSVCPNFVFMVADSIKSAQSVRMQYGQVDILFIDTTHTYEQTMAEFNAWKPYLSDNAIVCLDDLFRPGMDRAWQDVPGRKLRLDVLHDGSPGVGGGFGVVWSM